MRCSPSAVRGTVNAPTRWRSASPAAAAPSRAQGGRTRIVFWHAMNGVLNDEVNRICAEFNGAQQGAEIVPVFKGTYAETLTAAIAAWRANQAPHLVQMFDSTVVRAHVSAAGAKGGSTSRRSAGRGAGSPARSTSRPTWAACRSAFT